MFESAAVGCVPDWLDDPDPWLGELEPPPELARLSECQPSGWLALELDTATVEPADLDDAGLVEAVVGLDRVGSWAAARQARLLAEFARRRRGDHPKAVMEDKPWLGSRFAPDEIGLALGVPRGVAAARLAQAVQLTTTLPATLGKPGRSSSTPTHGSSGSPPPGAATPATPQLPGPTHAGATTANPVRQRLRRRACSRAAHRSCRSATQASWSASRWWPSPTPPRRSPSGLPSPGWASPRSIRSCWPGWSARPACRSRGAAALGALASGTAVLLAAAGLGLLGSALDLRLAFPVAVLPLLAALTATAVPATVITMRRTEPPGGRR